MNPGEVDASGLVQWLETGPFRDVDREVARFFLETAPDPNLAVAFAAAMASYSTQEGHAYWDFEEGSVNRALSIEIPEEFAQALLASPHVSESNYSPLVLAPPNRVYLYRYFEHEQKVVRKVRSLLKASEQAESDTILTVRSAAQLDETQRAAVEAALSHRFHIITGGPGTGKTSVAIEYLLALLEAADEPERLRIAAVAPTGKAASRLQESFHRGLARNAPAESLAELILEVPCMTVHRLLGYLPHQTSFRCNAKNPIACDALIVDEASMIDLPLMRRLLDAMPASCRLLMLGDANQLSSVEVGTTFSDLLAASQAASSPLRGHVSNLKRSYRFPEDSGIARFCQIINSSSATEIRSLLEDGTYADLSLRLDLTSPRSIRDHIVGRAVTLIETYGAEPNPDILVASIGQRIALCSTRTGPLGTDAMNARVLEVLDPYGRSLNGNTLPVGTPIIVSENSYDLDLFNGDVGMVCSTAPQTGSQVAFPGNDGPRLLPLAQLPRYVLAFALTIHKSQGSEFDEVDLVIDSLREDFLTRELVYTGASRARRHLSIYGDMDTLARAASQTVSRATSIAEALST